MLTLGLTGGIGSGKSAVSSVLDELGATIVDADKIAREVVEPGTPGLQRVADAFGAGVLTADGALDRPALAQIVFNDEEARQTLNGIVHPLVRGRSEEIVAAAGQDAIIVHDIPLLAEGPSAPTFHLVLVVTTPVEVRLDRLTGQRGMDREDALARIKTQASDEQRLAIADVVLDNGGTPVQLRAQIERVWNERLVPFAAGFADQRAATVRVDAREGAIARERARLEWTLSRLDAGVSFESEDLAVVTGDAAQLRDALQRAGWFGADVLAPADPGGSLRVRIGAETA